MNYLFISGGIDSFNRLLKYDYEFNSVVEICELKNNYQCHTSFIHNYILYIIGGANSQKCEGYMIEEEKHFCFPDLNYDRQDSSLFVFNEKFLVVFGGFSSSKIEYLNNFERIDLANPTKFELISIYYPDSIKGVKTHSLIFPASVENPLEFIILGGMYYCEAFNHYQTFSIQNYNLKVENKVISERIAFSEKNLVEIENSHYQFNYGCDKLLIFENEQIEIINVIY